jgi:site-specific DNA-methyltransferase (adenine-specific)
MSIAYWKGDCLEVMEKLPSKSIDLFICDLPYGCLSQPKAVLGAGLRKIKEKGEIPKLQRNDKELCAWDIKIDLEKFWIQVKRLAKKENTPVLMFCNTKFGAELISSNPDWFRYDLVWAKSNAVGFLCANKMPMRSHEMIYVFSKKGAFYNRIDIEGDFPKGGGGISSAKFLPIAGMPNTGTTKEGVRCVKSVIEVANKKIKGGHPTQKPADLYEWLIKRYCPANSTILDPTAGSFSSCEVAKQLGHKAIGIEMNDAFFYKGIGKLL